MQSAPHDNPLAKRLASSTRRPIDFTQRNVKMKIFVLLGLLIFVLAIAERAREPGFWKWLADMDKWGQQEEAVSSRLLPPPLRTNGDPEGTFIAQSDEKNASDKPVEGNTPAVAGQIDPVERAWEQGWKDVFQRLEPDQRLLLYEVLYCGLHNQSLPAEKSEAAANLLATINTLWEDYQASAFQSLVTLTPADQSLWVDVLRQVNRRWSDDVRPSLQAVLDARTPTEQEQRLMAKYQATLDALATAQIEDDTIFLRPAEREIWLRLEERVRDTRPGELKKQSVGTVSYLQLFKEAADFRGKVVTFRGTAKRAYRVPAPENYLGVKEHYVLWLMPEGASSPIVLYALGLPEGFPQVVESDDGAMTKLHEDLLVTGIYLKRGAYLGKDGTYTAPLVLANTPEWIKRPAEFSDTSRFNSAPAWLWPAVGAAAVIALLAFGLAYWRMRRGEREAHQIVAEGMSHEALALAELKVLPSTAEALRQMEQQSEAPRSE